MYDSDYNRYDFKYQEDLDEKNGSCDFRDFAKNTNMKIVFSGKESIKGRESGTKASHIFPFLLSQCENASVSSKNNNMKNSIYLERRL
jgi:hypothetical protein